MSKILSLDNLQRFLLIMMSENVDLYLQQNFGIVEVSHEIMRANKKDSARRIIGRVTWRIIRRITRRITRRIQLPVHIQRTFSIWRTTFRLPLSALTSWKANTTPISSPVSTIISTSSAVVSQGKSTRVWWCWWWCIGRTTICQPFQGLRRSEIGNGVCEHGFGEEEVRWKREGKEDLE